MRRRDWWLAAGVSTTLTTAVAGLLVALVVAVPPGPTFDGPPRFVLTYAVDVPGELQRHGRALHADGQVREAVDDLNARVRLDQHVEVRVGACGYGSSYDFAAQRIDLCLDDAALALVDLADAGSDDPDGLVLDVWHETTMHEAAHALFDVMGVGYSGSEEDAADELAAWFLLQDDPGGQGARAAVAAAEHYRVLAELYEADTSLGHSPDVERASAYACWAVGADPAVEPVEGVGLPAGGRAGCEQAWDRVLERWADRLDEAEALIP